jgi:hypothetical protein
MIGAKHATSLYQELEACQMNQKYIVKLTLADGMHIVSDQLYPQAKKIVVVMHNLNTHKPSSFSQAFEAAEAHRLCQQFEFQ